MSGDDAIGSGSSPFGAPDDAAPPGSTGRGGRPRYRPPIGIPNAVPEVPFWRGTAASVALHALIIALILAPLFAPAILPELVNQGAGGPGPAGGGGGRRGTGGDDIKERIQYIQPPSAPAAPPDPTQFQQPVEQKPPVVTPPTPPVAPAVDIKTDVKLPDVASTISAVRGSGGGTGSDGTNGSGPGSGGGVGSGVGTGRGSSNGPGTGGGPGTVYPPVASTLVIPPMDLAQKYRPYVARIYYDVDEKGQATLLAVEPPARDRGWGKRFLATLQDVRFRPATRWDGTPVRDTAVITVEIP